MLYSKEEIQKAKALIDYAIKETKDAYDRHYALGLVEMAYELGAITLKELNIYRAIVWGTKP